MYDRLEYIGDFLTVFCEKQCQQITECFCEKQCQQLIDFYDRNENYDFSEKLTVENAWRCLMQNNK